MRRAIPYNVHMLARAPRTATCGYRVDTPDDLPAGPLHVFGYGSLLWRPGFAYERMEQARLYGFHRALRVWSVHHRGSRERPGLVLGLDAGGSCLGCVFEVRAADKRSVAEYLWEREMVTAVYVPRILNAYVSGTAVPTLAFTLDRNHPQYAGCLSTQAAAGHIAGARGLSGPNPEYVRETVAHLEQLGMHDRGLAAVLDQLDRQR